MEKAIFEKNELLKSQLFFEKKDLAAAVLQEGIYYTREEALKLVLDYERKKIR